MYYLLFLIGKLLQKIHQMAGTLYFYIRLLLTMLFAVLVNDLPPDVAAVAGLTLLSWVSTNTRALFILTFTGNKLGVKKLFTLRMNQPG